MKRRRKKEKENKPIKDLEEEVVEEVGSSALDDAVAGDEATLVHIGQRDGFNILRARAHHEPQRDEDHQLEIVVGLKGDRQQLHTLHRRI